jgi:hypothetical protein
MSAQSTVTGKLFLTGQIIQYAQEAVVAELAKWFVIVNV